MLTPVQGADLAQQCFYLWCPCGGILGGGKLWGQEGSVGLQGTWGHVGGHRGTWWQRGGQLHVTNVGGSCGDGGI